MIKITPLGGPLGIVGADESKFSKKGEDAAHTLIRRLITKYAPSIVVSGACPRGGVDIWAEEIALDMRVPYLIFPPKEDRWSGFRKRNFQIAGMSKLVCCLALDSGPPWFTGDIYCHHCDSWSHIGNGGCWTMHHAHRHKLFIVKNRDDR